MGLKIFSEQFRDEVLKLNLKTPPDVVLGLVNLSGSGLYSAYVDALGKDAVIKSDKASVIIKDPGNVITDATAPRQRNFNKNLTKPTNTNEVVINDFNVIDPGDIVSDSVSPRQSNLNRNLQTPPEILANISSGYLSSLNKDTTIGDSIVKNPGGVDDAANVERIKLFSRNKPINVSDPSENDPLFSFLSQGGYTYTSLLQSIGRLTLINDLNIPNAISVSILSNQTPEVSLQLQLQQNRYFPVEFNQFESTVLSLKPDPFSKPYIDAYNSGIFVYSASQKYEPSSFLNLRTSINPLSIMTNTADPMSFLLNGGTPPLTNETLMMNIAALELKFNFETRIKRAIERETLGKTNIDEALTNPIAAANILRNPYGWFNLFESNYTISVPSTAVGKAAQFQNDLIGLTNPVNLEFAFSTNEDLVPKCFGNQTDFGADGRQKNRFDKFVDSLLGKSASKREDRNAYFIRRTGAGQRFSLFYSVGRNKYQPDYLNDSETALFLGQQQLQALRKLGGYFGIGSGEQPSGNFYIGNKSRYEDPFYLMQDADGHQVKSNQAIVEAIKKQNPNNSYEEPGYSGSSSDNGQLSRPQGVSEYGSLKTNFIWKSSVNKDFGLDTAFNFETNQKSQQIELGDIAQKSYVGTIDSNLLSVNKYTADKFRECSILYTTSQLLEKGITTDIGKFNSPIDQTVTKFYDGYDFMSRGNATILPKKTERLNRQGEVIGYHYSVPGLDPSGKRNDREMYKEAELCRVWTKPRPYAKITDLIRYKELIRKERNSVIDRFGNYNIFPSELNVNGGYGRKGSGLGDATVEFFGEKRARKYMFSIENLAWRDYLADNYLGKSELPSCEKGPNGGRIMWFPPYDIQFTDNTSANWTAHQFLGRPEPIYTYNNSERTGTLSWKIVVDHPSVLNLLTQKELARLSDGEVDELLSAFWAGCVEFDIFELARIWNQFSQSDIDFFKKVLGDLDLTKSNELIKPAVQQRVGVRQPQSDQNFDINVELPKSLINNHNLFFENDVPLNPDAYNNKTSPIYDTGKIESYDILFENYYQITKGNNAKNAEATKNTYGRSIELIWINYQYTIGKESVDTYMEATRIDPKYFGMNAQYELIEKDLSDTKYIGFDLEINIEAHASPLGPEQSNVDYNNKLSRRRFISVVKWLVTKVLNKGTLGKIYFEDGIDVTPEELDTRLSNLYNGKAEIVTFKRENGKPNGGKDDIKFVLTQAKAINATDAIKAITANPPNIGPNNNIYFTVDAPKPGEVNKVKYCCFESADIANQAITDNWLSSVPELSNLPPDQIGTIEAKTGRPYKDIVCGMLSIQSSYARRVTLNVKVSKKPENPAKTEIVPSNATLQIPSEQTLNEQNVTKRDIAQRIINKMITECDYFELLKEDTPFLYESLKQKLKYFQPAFHAITPEGLNARLTFLQQCLRPGETIKRKVGEDFCDASNTAFGKPPICVLRIGDFYHTKIVIDSLIISYDPLVWDLNPEGIGAQPMIANIQLSFKYIGGSGLRKYVDELQNALSFNYYGNADIYDDRTFANKDLFERNLVNLEQSFFDNNTLDLIPIISAAERIVPSDYQPDVPYGTIGIVRKTRTPTTAGGNYSSDIFSANVYDSSVVYQPYSVVSSNNKFYVRKADNQADLTAPNTLNGSLAPVTNKNYWEEISWRNYGEQAFRLEFNSVTGNLNSDDQFLDKSYFNWYEIHYGNTFREMYNTYGKIYVDNHKFNTILKPENTLLNLVLNKNYNKQLTSSDGKIPFDDLATLPNQDGAFNNVTGSGGKYSLFKIFDQEAAERNYVEYGSIGVLNTNISQELRDSKQYSLKLHMYPQNYMYKIGDGKTLVSEKGVFDQVGVRFNPGNFTGGFKNGLKVDAEVAGFYLKNYTNYSNNIQSILTTLSAEMETKTKLDLNHFWTLNLPLFKEYNEYFETQHKEVFREYLINKFSELYNNISSDKITTLRNLERNNAKMGALINSLSVVLDGYDFRNDETKRYSLEVIPNAYELSTDAKTLFGYEPYSQYRTLSFNNFQVLDFTDVMDIVYERDFPNRKLQFLSLGNGSYFFKQITKDSEIKLISGNDFTSDNYLPESISIRDNDDSDQKKANFDVTTGVMLNTKQDKNGNLNGQTTTLSVQPTGSEDKAGSYKEYYNMKYTFEKLNYEFFEFANKNLDVMLNDNYLKRDFDIDIKYDETLDFYTQLLAYPASTMGIFYNGINTNLKNIPIGYYTLNPESVSGTGTVSIVENINNFIEYEFTITEEIVKYSAFPGLTSLIGTKLKLSGLIDLLFIDALASITDQDKAEILKRIQETPIRRNSDSNGKTKTNKDQQRYKKMENILNKIFENIKNYVSQANSKTTPLYNSYVNNEKEVIKKINKILVNSEDVIVYDPNVITDKLLKGGIDDYTLVMKDTNGFWLPSVYNYQLFTNTKALFNIISQTEAPEVIQTQDVVE